MASARARAYRAERDAKARINSTAQREAQLRAREEQLAAEEKLVRENPLQWMGRKGVNGDELARHLTDNPKPTEADRIAALEAKIEADAKERQTLQTQYQRQQEERRLHSMKVEQADAFVEFLDTHEAEFADFANLPDEHIRAEYTNLMDIARSRGETFTKKEVAQYLNRLVKESKDGRASRRTSKRAAPSEDAKRPTANGATGAAGTADTRTLSSDLATTSGLPANLSQMSADERAEVYRQMYAKGAAR
jgi:hypothetical protein